MGAKLGDGWDVESRVKSSARGKGLISFLSAALNLIITCILVLGNLQNNVALDSPVSQNFTFRSRLLMTSRNFRPFVVLFRIKYFILYTVALKYLNPPSFIYELSLTRTF